MDDVSPWLGEPEGGASEPDLDVLLRQVLERVGRVVDDRQRVSLLLDAVVGIAADLALDSVLDRIVETAARLAGARYAALGVLSATRSTRLQAFITHGLTPEQRERIGDLPRGRGILGLIIDRPEPLRLHDLKEHAASYGFPPDHPPMHSFLGVPVRIRDKVFGNLYLTEKLGGGDFTTQDEAVVVALAAAAGVVIENARLYEEAARRERWQAASAEVTTLLLGATEPAAALQVVAERAREIAGADVATVTLPGDDGRLRLEAGAGLPGTHVGHEFAGEASLAGSVMAGAERLVVEDAAEDPRSRHDLLNDLGPVVLVPLRSEEGVAGVLALGWSHDNGDDYADLDLDLPARFAAQAGLALRLAGSRTDREKLALFEDRDRIARDLHDLVIQRLFAIGLSLDNTARMSERPEFAQRVSGAVDDIDATIRDIRSSIFALSSAVESRDIRRDVAEAVDRATRALKFRPSVRFVGPVNSRIGRDVAPHVTAVLAEALSNVVRHAGATHVDVVLEVAEALVLTVQDDGGGITGDVVPSGLRNMRERAESLGGTLEVESSPAGTTIRWTVPV